MSQAVATLFRSFLSADWTDVADVYDRNDSCFVVSAQFRSDQQQATIGASRHSGVQALVCTVSNFRQFASIKDPTGTWGLQCPSSLWVALLRRIPYL